MLSPTRKELYGLTFAEKVDAILADGLDEIDRVGERARRGIRQPWIHRLTLVTRAALNESLAAHLTQKNAFLEALRARHDEPR